MKKKPIGEKYALLLSNFKHIFRVMKLTFLLFLLCISGVWANKANSQTAKVNIQAENTQMKDIISQIEAQTDYLFVYNYENVDLSRKISLNAPNISVAEALKIIFRNSDVVYAVEGNNILLMKNTTQEKQQNGKRITGKVTDAKGEAIIGANIVEKGTTNGTTTDMDGNYVMNVSPSSVIQVSYIGYVTQEYPVQNKTSLNIVLREDLQALEEVVVVGYGTQKKEVVTAAITTIKSEEIALSPSGNMAAGLAGRLSGVVINTRSGEAGNESTSILIRGRSSFQVNNNEPLYVVDGIARSEEGGILSRLDPEDIESITVLKDASAAIYGARAANGVILVTTKRGKIDKKPTITFTYSHSFSQPTRVVKMADSYSYATAQNLANEVRGLPTVWTDEEIQKFADGSDPIHYPNTNWYKAAQKDWSHQDKANLQISGGSQNVQYLVSAGMLNQGTPYNNGAMKNSMYNVRSNIDAKINENIKVTFDLFGKHTKRILPRNGSANGLGIYSHIGLSAPTKHAYWPGTNYPAPGWGNDNVLTYTSGEAGYINSPTWVFNGQATIDIKLPWVKGLSVKGSFAYDYFTQQWKQFQNVNYVYNYDEATNTYEKYKSSISAPSLFIEEKRTENITGNVRINYLNTFADVHTIDAFIGFEQNESKYSVLSGKRTNFPTGALEELDAGDRNTMENNGGSSKSARQNYFGRVLYDYDNKYMLQFQFRYDGSQNFPKGNRFGFFPGVSAGWTISRESFMQNINWLNNLKLRGSWGKMGYDAVNAYQYMTMYTLSGGLVFNGVQNQGISQATFPNPNITWETAESIDLGLESRFLKDRLTFEFDLFKTNRSNILAAKNASVPKFTGLTLPDENIGKSENKGLELMLGYRDNINKDFSYSVSGNFTYARNKVIYMDEAPLAEEYQKQEGRPIGSSLVYKAIGLYSEADIADPNVPKRPGAVAGDIKVLDANGDGEINSLDRIRQDLTNVPEITYGLNINLSWKRFNLILGFQGQARVLYNLRTDWVNPSTAAGGGNILQWWTEDTMTPANPNGSKPRLGTSLGIGGTTFTQLSAAFFKLKNAELGYNLPEPILTKIGLERARIYVSGTNLFSFDSLGKLGVDPEAANGGWDLNPMRLVNFGVNVSF